MKYRKAGLAIATTVLTAVLALSSPLAASAATPIGGTKLCSGTKTAHVTVEWSMAGNAEFQNWNAPGQSYIIQVPGGKSTKASAYVNTIWLVWGPGTYYATPFATCA